ncbi:hypothetical protein F8388_024120 [Cannabis sativa]|uniref:Uncharacterized protein n=1 Tax=Cannabis sativa TaxID=3483 RepID=A0A7J6GKU0_CANSA|nr:hypothetical protein F8388_024120 [Cannabis sativa]KAF4383428.1 hypothetical protein G4B88_024002 [Cannabis sativa]
MESNFREPLLLKISNHRLSAEFLKIYSVASITMALFFPSLSKQNMGSDDSTISIGQAILNMIKSCVNKYPVVIPSTTLYTDRFMQSTLMHKLLASNYNSMLAKQCNIFGIIRPNNILDKGSLKITKNKPLLEIKYNYSILCSTQQVTSSSIEYSISSYWKDTLLYNLIFQILNQNLVAAFVKNSESITSHKNSRSSNTSLCILYIITPTNVVFWS